jgi:hypothetical protein
LNHARGEGDDTPGFGIVIIGIWFFADAVSPGHYFGTAPIIAGSMTLKLLAYATRVPGPWPRHRQAPPLTAVAPARQVERMAYYQASWNGIVCLPGQKDPSLDMTARFRRREVKEPLIKS